MSTKNNPFSAGGIVSSNLFGGRVEYIQKLLKRLNSVKSGKPSSFYLYGERGIGKTALAKLISLLSTKNDKELYSLNFITSYYCAQQNQSFKSVLESSLNNLADGIEKSLLTKIGSRLGKVFKNGKFSIGAFGVEASYESEKNEKSFSNEQTVILKDQVVSILRNILIHICSEAQDKKDGILIIIDEMDKINNLESVASIIRGISTELDFENRGNISFLFIGYHDGFEKFIRGDESVRRLIDPILLLEMPEHEVIETFEKGFLEVGIYWDSNSLKNNIWMTGGYPLAIQVVGYHLVDIDSDNNIDAEDWKKATYLSASELIKKEFSSFYSFDMKGKKNSDKILIAFAVAGSSLNLKEIELISNVKNPSQYINILKKNGALTRDESNNVFKIRRGLLRNAILLDMARSFTSEEGLKIYTEYLNRAREIIISKREKVQEEKSIGSGEL